MSISSVIKGSGKDQGMIAALVRTGANVIGGASASYARKTFAEAFPNFKMAGTMGVVLVAIGLHYYAASQAGLKGILREIAAGMAGFVGQDVWLWVSIKMGWNKWDPKSSYKKGATITYNDQYYKAKEDIPLGQVVAEPGKDDRWVKVVIAQGLEPAEWTDFAQALMGNDSFLDGVVREQITIFGPELANCIGRDITQNEANQIYSGMRDSLKSVVQKYSAA